MTAVRLNPINMSKYHQDMKDAFTLELERARLSYDELAGNIVENVLRLFLMLIVLLFL